MDNSKIIAAIDEQINRLEQAKKLLSDVNGTGSGRTGRRRMSAAARERIAAAQRARWAKQKRAKAQK